MDQIEGQPAVEIAFADESSKVTGPVRVAQNSGGAGWPWVAGDDQGVAMIWSDKRTGAFDIRFADLDAQALALQNEGALRDDAKTDALLGRMIKTGFGYLAAWEDMRGDDNQIWMALTDGGGKMIYTGLVEEPNTGDANWPNMAWTGGAVAIVYYQWRSDNPQIFMSFIDATGKRVAGLHDLQVSSNPKGSMARFPDVVWNGTDLGVAWIDTREGSPQLYFARVTCKS
jgi:hypothetical protein